MSDALPVVLQGLAGIIVLALSFQVLFAKREVAALRVAVERGTTAFVGGAPLPDVPLNGGAGGLVTLREACGSAEHLLIVLTSSRCPACTRFAKEWGPRVGVRADLQFLALHVQEDAPDDSVAVLLLRRAGVASSDVVDHLRVQEVPAVISVNRDCTISAAGAGLVASRYLLRTVVGS